MYTLSGGPLGSEIFRFYAGVNEAYTELIWQGNTYVPIPMTASGFEYNGKQFTRPKFQISNVGGVITGAMSAYDDFIGCKLTRKRTLAKYLDAVNFINGNPTADPAQQYPDEPYYVTQKVQEDKTTVEFELGTVLDIAGLTIPIEQCIANTCRFQYRTDPRCAFSGGAVADQYDNPTTDITKDACSRKVSGCKLRFGANNPIPIGAFAGISLIEFK